MSSDRTPVATLAQQSSEEDGWSDSTTLPEPPEIPAYLEETYWWAYLRENSLWFFERPWVVNLILWGNMRRLADEVLSETQLAPRIKVLQLACVYGSFSNRLAEHIGKSGSSLDIVDVAPIQLGNARRKLAEHRNVHYRHEDSSDLASADGQFDQTVLFFLMHEQPESVRLKTVQEAIRVTRPGGKIVIVDYHRPTRFNPLRYVMKPILHFLEPFALDLWRRPLESCLPDGFKPASQTHKTYFGGLYQKLVLTR